MENRAVSFKENIMGDEMKELGLDRRAKKFSLLDEKLSQFAVVFAMLIVMKFCPAIVDVDLIWSIPLCAVCAVWAFYVYFFKDEEKGGADKVEWNRRIKKFNFFELVLAHLAFIFALFIAVKVVPALKQVTLEWSIPLFTIFAIKPFYIFWIKDESS